MNIIMCVNKCAHAYFMDERPLLLVKNFVASNVLINVSNDLATKLTEKWANWQQKKENKCS